MRAFAAVGLISSALIMAAPANAAGAPAPHLGYHGMGGFHGGAAMGHNFGGGRWNGAQRSGNTWTGSHFGGTHWNGNGGARWNGGVSNRWTGGVGSRWTGRTWNPGHHWTGNWGRYRRPFAGFVLPSFWLGSNYSILDYWDYGLSEPPYGYNWSRYYDDAVLIDRNGRVQDFVPADQEYRDYGDDGRQDYSGRDDRDGDDYFGGDDRVTYSGTWRGTWTGSYEGGPPTTYHGEFRSDDRGPAPELLPPPRFEGPPPRLDYGPAGWSGSFVSGGPTVTTITIQSTPVVTTTTSFVEESYAPRVAHAKARVRWHPKPRPRCYCR